MQASKWRGLLTHRRAQESKAAKLLFEARAAEAAQVSKLNQLDVYFKDYVRQSSQTKINQVQSLKSRASFCEKLRQAMELQSIEVARSKQLLNQALTHWRETYQQLMAVTQLIDEERIAVLKHIERVAQRENDELVALVKAHRPPQK